MSVTYKAGDLVLVAGPFEKATNTYYALVVEAPQRHPILEMDSRGGPRPHRVWHRPMDQPNKFYWAIPDWLELVQRGEQ